MKVLSLYKSNGPSFVSSGWSRVLVACGHDWTFYDPKVKSTHDAFAEIKPDLYLGTTYDIDRALIECLARHPQCKVVLYASAWGELADKVDRTKMPIDVVKPDERRMVELLKQRTGKPDLVWLHLLPSYVDPVLGGWRELGCTPVGLLNAADVFAYHGGQFDQQLRSDISFIGGYWSYKAKTIDRYFLPLCHPDWKGKGQTSPARLNVKIWGNQAWPVPQYLGLLPEERARDVFVSATVCPNVSELHSQEIGYDLIERPWKVLFAGGFCVSDYVAGFRQVFTEEELPMMASPAEYREAILHYIHHPDDRLPIMRAGRKKVLEGGTYFHRVADLLGHLGLTEEEVRCRQVYKEWLTQHEPDLGRNHSVGSTPGVDDLPGE